ncbi:hypothetical protein NL676_034562 [Syzygium grande]|nr:hypothetical protein NL676_034562 [Syzygium grande]
MDEEEQKQHLESPLLAVSQEKVSESWNGLKKEEIFLEMRRQLLGGAFDISEPNDTLFAVDLSDVCGSSGRAGSHRCFNGHFLCFCDQL